MFPLSSVLFPLGVLPLHVFEPRYLQMIAEAIDEDGEFGVVLIERGPEVGGGDQRFSVGTIAKIAQAAPVGDTRLGVISVGTSRFRVEHWLPEEPYPAAEVTMLNDDPVRGDVRERLVQVDRLRRRVLALASELGADVGDPDLDLPDDPTAAVWYLCAAAPIGQLDRQEILETDAPEDRLALLAHALTSEAEFLEARLAAGSS